MTEAFAIPLPLPCRFSAAKSVYCLPTTEKPEAMSELMLTATCMRGFEELLADEIEDLGDAAPITQLHVDRQAVRFATETENGPALLYHANLRLRTAIAVLEPLASFRVYDADDLYKKVYELPWERYLDARQTFAIQSSVHSRLFTHSHFVSLKMKDAVVDRFRDRSGARPSVELNRPDLRLHIRIEEDRCTISRNSSGDPLFKRGYRSRVGEAPLNEALAAGLILLSGWNWKNAEPLVDPMTGAGTIPIEAAWVALKVAPGLFREQFGFMNWPDHQDSLFQSIRNDLLRKANKNIAATPELPIFASDSSPVATDLAAENFGNAGLEGKITLQTKPFDQLKLPVDHGTIIMNPPYGERMKKHDIDNFYKMIGDTMKKNFAGFTAWIFSSNIEALKHVHLASSKRIALRNGPLDCMFQRYELYSGSAEQSDTAHDTGDDVPTESGDLPSQEQSDEQ